MADEAASRLVAAAKEVEEAANRQAARAPADESASLSAEFVPAVS